FEGLVGGVALHLVERHFLDAMLLHRIAEAFGARLAVVARERDGDKADRTLVPVMLLERGGERLARSPATTSPSSSPTTRRVPTRPARRSPPRSRSITGTRVRSRR